jgi:hypothetical protein
MQNPLDTQIFSAYTSTIKKEVLIKKVKRRVHTHPGSIAITYPCIIQSFGFSPIHIYGQYTVWYIIFEFYHPGHMQAAC